MTTATKEHTPAAAAENKAIYTELHDQIIVKRFQAKSPIRRHAHHRQYQAFVDLIPAGSTVLDAGCGEGVLSVMLAQKGCKVTGVDLSEPNIKASNVYAESQGVAEQTDFMVGDAENLPVPDKSFDYVISSHVLEHLPDFVKGASELKRVARKQAIIAIPTCLNALSLVQLGGDKYWTFSRRTPYAIFFGFLRVCLALVTGKEGVNESYAGRSELIHIYRFPWRGKSLIEQSGLKVEKYGASTFALPYFPFLLPIARLLEPFCWLPGLRNFGFGTTYVCNAEAVQEKQDEWAWQWERLQNDTQWLFRDWIAPNTLEDFQGKSVLDCGCGGGQHLQIVAPHCSRAVGVDLNATESAGRHTAEFEHVSVQEADIAQMDLGEQFDIVYSIGVLHHTDNPTASFRNIAKHCKPGGRVIVWVYSHEGNFLNRTAVEWVKRVALLKMPRQVSWVVGQILTALLYIPIYTVYLLPIKALPFYEYFSNWRKMSFKRNFLNVFDKLNAPQTHFLKEENMREWFSSDKFTNVHIAPYKGVSWCASGTVL